MKAAWYGDRVFATIIPFVFFQLPMIPAILLMEGGSYSSEIGEAGQPVGTIWIFLVYLLVAMTAFALVFFALPHRAPARPTKEYTRIANIASLLLLLFYAIPVLVYGPTFVTGLTRYEFLDQALVSYFNVKLYLGIICLYHGWMLRLNRRLWHLGFFLAVLLVMVAWGEKFSGPQYAVTYFVAGLALAGGSLKRIILPAALFVPVVLAIWAAPTLLADRGDELVAAFTDRLARQAQVLYKVVDEPPSGIDARATLELLDYFGDYTPERNGMNYLKDQYIADDLRDVHEGSFAAGYPAILISDGVVTGMVIIFFLELLRFALMREILIVGMDVENIICWPVFLYCLNYIGKIYESGNTYLLTSPVFIGMTIFIIVSNRMKGPVSRHSEAHPNRTSQAIREPK